MELIHQEIEAGANSVKLAWTLRRLLSPAAMEIILAEPKKRTASVKITIMNTEDKNRIIKNDM